MIIDFHTHAFPDALAVKTIPMLAEKSGTVPHTDGTADGLAAALSAAGVDLGVVLPVVTRPSQFRSVNAFAAELNRRPGLISFGGIHPDDEDIPGHMEEIRALGLPGVKIHPDYQNTFIDDPRYVAIAKEAVRLGLILITHAGVDDGFPETVHCPPDRAAAFPDAVYDGREPDEAQIVFAHGGGNRQFDRVIEHLCGRNVYFDLSYIFAYADPAKITEVIRTHGAHRILFASDCPWGNPGEGIRFVQHLPLSKKEKDAILGENAATLLKRNHTI